MKHNNILIYLWEQTKTDKGITIIDDYEKEYYFTYKTLWKKSGVIYRQLKKMGAQKGNEVLIRCDEPEQFMFCYWACVMGGFIAVPLEKGRTEYGVAMTEKILAILNQPYLLHSQGENSILPEQQAERKLDLSTIDFSLSASVLSIDDLIIPSSDDLIHVQFSSGSTGEPKGVEMRHYNLVAHITSTVEHYKITKEDTVLSWQPLTHCYGLTVYHLLAIVVGIDQYLIPTDTFIQNPLLWMEKVNQYRVTRIGTIPFALEHFLNVYQKTKEPQYWDLSCVKSMTIGGEQVGADLLRRCYLNLKEQNLVNCNILPLYGLSETTTIVATAPLDMKTKAYNLISKELEIGELLEFVPADESDEVSFLEMGTPLSSIQVRIIDDNDKVLPEKALGYISVRGDSVCKGYYRDSNANQQLFSEDKWLHTGDVGFMIDGRVVVVGRDKELVVLNGKKYSCIKIENHIKSTINNPAMSQVVIGNGLIKNTDAEQVLAFIETTLQPEHHMVQLNQLFKEVKQAVYELTSLEVKEVIPVDRIPRTYSGKIRRRYLMNQFNHGCYDNMLSQMRQQNTTQINPTGKPELSKKEILSIIVGKMESLLNIQISDYNHTFKECGIVSVNIPAFLLELEEMLAINIGAPAMFNYPTINQFAEFIYHSQNIKNKGETLTSMSTAEKSADNKVAIIGMSCRLPGGANDVSKFWEVLLGGVDGVIDVPETRWDSDMYYHEDGSVPGKMYCNKSGFLDIPVNDFDARFFNISPKEVMAMDPQQRLLLELTWEAFENACLNITHYYGSDTGVYLGISSNEYMLSHLYSGNFKEIDAYSLTGTAFSVACGRISYTFGFEGPSFAVDTACSSGLTAIHLACNALKAGETDMAVAAGVNLLLSPNTSVGFTKLSATSPDGHSKAFDASANGYGRAEGGGVILLKRLSDAIKDQDNILGVICGSEINQDGRSNGLTAPNGISQANLIRKTLNRSHLTPLDIDYVEMHGTGTKLGDPIEVKAVAETYGLDRTKENPLWIGSVKSNIGHLEPASGFASIIKVLLSMKHDLIPANLNFNTPNPLIDWDNIAVRVIDKQFKWEKKQGPRRAAISGFGFGGSNAHILVEEYQPESVPVPENTSVEMGLDYLLKISAKSKKSLREYVLKFIKQIENCKESDFIDLLYSANKSRVDFEYRLAVTAKTKEDISYKLKGFLAGSEPEELYCNIDDNRMSHKHRKIVFMFTGQGSQYINMGKDLFETNEVFKDAMAVCDRLMKPYILKSIIDLLYGESASEEIIGQTVYAQPLIFAIEYALYKMWTSYGVNPDMVMGHSIGEYAAAVAAGIYNLEDAVKLVCIRGRLMDSAPGLGSMGTIFADEETVAGFVNKSQSSVSIAAVNAKETCVISGDLNEVESILTMAEQNGIRTRKLKVSHGFHSSLMDPILNDFMQIAKEVTYAPANISFVSALHARKVTDAEVLDDAYWTQHIRSKVDFYHAISSIEDKQECIFLEIGATRVLSALCKLILSEDVIIGSSLNVKKDDGQQLSETIAMLYAAGVNIDWDNIELHGKKTWNKVEVPNYPYDKSVYWKGLTFEQQYCGQMADVNYDPLLGQRIDSLAAKNTIIFQRIYKADEPFFMSEHIIFDTAISPAAAHVSLLLSAVKKVKNPRSCTLKSVELRIPLAVPNGEERLVQICLSEVEESTMKFQIASKDAHSLDSNWLLHTQGEIITYDHYFDEDVKGDIEDFKNRKADDVVPEEGVYAMMRSGGFALGEGFRRIVKSSCYDGESICTVEPSDDIPDLDMYEVYPGVMDCVLQTQLCVLVDELGTTNDGKDEDSKRTVIPYYLGSVSYNYKPCGKLWIHGQSNVSDGVVYSDLSVYNEDGEVIIKMLDTMANLTNRSGLLREIKNGFNSLFYHTDWLKSERNEEEKLIMDGVQYVVIADTEAEGELLKEKLNNEKINVKTLLSGDLQDQLPQLFSKLLTSHKIKFVYSKGFNSESDPLSKDCLKDLMVLVKAVIAEKLVDKVSIKILTKNVHPSSGSAEQNLSQALLWGFAKVMSIEYPQLYDGIIDTDLASFESGKTIFELVGNGSEEVRLSDGIRYVSKLLKHADYMRKQKEKPEAIVINPEASYLITGGTGALGMTFVEFLLNEGAKNIVLICRSTPKENVLEQIELFKNKGCSIELLYADVCDKSSIKEVLAEIQERIPKIEGVIHAAGSIKDQFISDLEWDDYTQVINPKADGAVYVYQALKEKPAYFIMLSSITSVIGNPGQSNYAAANYFMNRFAETLKADGVNAYTMCWGPWLTSGMASGNDAIDKNMSSKGIKAFSAEAGRQIIEQFFGQPLDNLMILDINWEKMNSNLMGNWQKMFLSNILSAFVTNEGQSAPEKLITNEMKGLTREEQKEYLLKHLQEKFGKIMGFGNGQHPAVDVGLREQGADSLMIFSMRNIVTKLLNIGVEVSTFFNHPTLIELTDYIVEELINFDDNPTDEDIIEVSEEDLMAELELLID